MINRKIGFLACIFLVMCQLKIHSQIERRFRGGLHLGINTAQIDGDGIFGFHKYGYHGGVFVRALLKKNMELGVDINYSTRGSHSGKKDLPEVIIKLNYIDVPLLFIIKDWKVGEDDNAYYKMDFLGGFSLGKLISSSSLTGIDKDFKTFDLSWTAGFAYHWARNWAYNVRYTRSLTPLYRYEKNNQAISMISYFLSLGVQLTF